METGLIFPDRAEGVITDGVTHGTARSGRWMPRMVCKASGRQIPPIHAPGTGPMDGFGLKSSRVGPCQEKPLREPMQARTVNRHRWTRRIA